MKFIIKTISYIFTFVLVLLIIAAILLGIVTKTVFNKDYIISKLDETNYYERVHNTFVTEVEDYLEQSGLEEIEIGNILTEEQVKKDVQNFFTQLYNGKTVTINKEDVKQQLETNLNKELKEKKITLTSIEQRAIDRVLDTITDAYATEVSYDTYSQYLEYLPKIMSIINKYLPIINTIIYVLPVALIILILLFNIKQFRIGLKYIGISILSSGILMIGIKLFTSIKMNLNNLYILSRATSDYIISIISDILNKITTVGIIGIIVGILAIIIGATYIEKN